MRKRTIAVIALVTFLSLVGIIFTQLYWVEQSLSLKEEQFDNSVRIAAKSVLNQLLVIKNDTAFQKRLVDISCRKPRLDVSDVVQPAVLDSLLNLELGAMLVDDRYYYGVYNKNNVKFHFGLYKGKEDYLLDSPFQFSISSIYAPGDYVLSIYYPAKNSIILRQMEIWLLFSVFFIVFVIISFSYVIYIILRQKKISQIRTDFINNLTHEFKTPIATSSLAAEMLLRPEMANNKPRIQKYAQVILDENLRLQNQVEQVLQIATFEQGKQQYKFREIDIHQLLESVIESFSIRLKEHRIDLTTKFDAAKSLVIGDKIHVMNVFFNLMDNAMKYCPDKPKISITTWNVKNGIHVSFKDNGIGISPEHHKNIFKNLFRVPTGNIHEVRGFGLGLYYTKTVINEHQGRIELQSELGKGSDFDVFLPFNHKKGVRKN